MLVPRGSREAGEEAAVSQAGGTKPQWPRWAQPSPSDPGHGPHPERQPACGRADGGPGLHEAWASVGLVPEAPLPLQTQRTPGHA